MNAIQDMADESDLLTDRQREALRLVLDSVDTELIHPDVVVGHLCRALARAAFDGADQWSHEADVAKVDAAVFRRHAADLSTAACRLLLVGNENVGDTQIAMMQTARAAWRAWRLHRDRLFADKTMPGAYKLAVYRGMWAAVRTFQLARGLG